MATVIHNRLKNGSGVKNFTFDELSIPY